MFTGLYRTATAGTDAWKACAHSPCTTQITKKEVGIMRKTNMAGITLEKLNKAIDTVIERYKSQLGKVFTRNRTLPLRKVILTLLSMENGTLDKELHKAGIDATKSAFSQRWKQVPPEMMLDILREFNDISNDTHTFKGYRLLGIDGTCVNMSRDPKAETYMEKGNYNQCHASPLYDLLNHTFLDCMIQPQPKQDEIGALLEMLDRNNLDDCIIIGDRGYESYNVIAHLLSRKVHFIIRVKQDASAMRDIKALPKREIDTDITVTITTTQTNKDKANRNILIQTRKSPDRAYSEGTPNRRWDFPSPYTMTFRAVKVMLDGGKYETLVTSLDRGLMPPSVLKQLYHDRWGIETAFREIKYNTGGITRLHGKSYDMTRQEIYAYMAFYNFASRIMNCINGVRDGYKLNRSTAMYLCREYVRETLKGKNPSGAKLTREIMKNIEPIRPDRQDKRKIKAQSFNGFTYRG